ncbi:MAG: NAD(+)--dinitrogen-reductase ADP-D-ribosyltransferase, partial [Bacteroidales bacterium]|nr:NAD(+)--dinitrogen-reductase ADP-D-ribosyltransferase [Bacteroidales bacterium]
KQAGIDEKRLGSGLNSVNELRDRDGLEKWEDEKWDKPSGEGSDSESSGQMGEEGTGDEDENEDEWDWGKTVNFIDSALNTLKGGVGSGIKGHTTLKDLDAKKYRNVNEFANANAKLLKEHGIKKMDQVQELFDTLRLKFEFTPMSKDESIDVISSRIKGSVMNAWFREEDKGAKEPLMTAIVNDDKVRSAGLKIMHENYQDLTGKKVPLKEFLNTEMTLYRGGTNTSDAFTSFTFNKEVAEKFGKKYKQGVMEIKIKPIDTLGSYQTTAESEVLVPKKVFDRVSKAATAGALSGEGGFVPMPEAYGPVRTEEEEMEILEETKEYWKKVREGAWEDYQKIFKGIMKGGVGSGIKGHKTLRDKAEDVLKSKEVEDFKERTKGTDGKISEGMPEFVQGMTEDKRAMWNKFKQVDDSSGCEFILKEWGFGNFNVFESTIMEAFKLGPEEKRRRTEDFSKVDSREFEKSKSKEAVLASFKQVYALNQEYMKKAYPNGTVTLYRGVDGNTQKKFKEGGFKEGDGCNLECYNVSSWTTDLSVAKIFSGRKGGVIVQAEVPIERILIHPEVSRALSPSGNIQEKEAVVIGGKVKGSIKSLGED